MSSQNNNLADKGGRAEEALRDYFGSQGSFVLRGVPVKEGKETVTDIDLWVYTRISAHSRHVAIVDIKNKKRGKPFERAIWVKGLQSALKADEAIIASNSGKDSVYSFTKRIDVRMLSPTVYDAILKRFSGNEQRLFHEDVESTWQQVLIGKENLKTKMEKVRLEVSKGISFHALNVWIDEAAELLRLAVEREREPAGITRAAYLCCALVAIAADYLGKNHSLSDSKTRIAHFRNGLLFGKTDTDSMKKYVSFAENVATEFVDPSGSAASKIRVGFERSIEDLPIEGLVEFFAKPSVGFELINGAIALEAECFSKNLRVPADLDRIEAKTIIGLISDYAGLKRRDVLGSKPDASKKLVAETPDATQTGLDL